MLDDEMLKIEDLAAYLKLKPQTIYKWAQRGKIPGAKFGKEWRFKRSVIERWIDSCMPAFDGTQPASDGTGQRSIPGATDRRPSSEADASSDDGAVKKRRTTKKKGVDGPQAN